MRYTSMQELLPPVWPERQQFSRLLIVLQCIELPSQYSPTLTMSHVFWSCHVLQSKLVSFGPTCTKQAPGASGRRQPLMQNIVSGGQQRGGGGDGGIIGGEGVGGNSGAVGGDNGITGGGEGGCDGGDEGGDMGGG